jgi:hypothetical protein
MINTRLHTAQGLKVQLLVVTVMYSFYQAMTQVDADIQTLVTLSNF